jgi:hypothetical protein
MDTELNGPFPAGAGRIDFYEAPDSAWDAATSRPTGFPSDLARFLARNPYVKVVRSGAVRLGRFSAQQIDVVAGNKTDRMAFDAGYCGETLSPSPCIPISADKGEEGFVSLALDAGAQTRLIDLKTSAGRVIIEVPGIGPITARSGVGRILRTLQIGAQ